MKTKFIAAIFATLMFNASPTLSQAVLPSVIQTDINANIVPGIPLGIMANTVNVLLTQMNQSYVPQLGFCTSQYLYYNASGVAACSAATAGNVSNVGTPTNGQIAGWTGATTIQGLNIGSGLSLVGTTLSATAVNPIVVNVLANSYGHQAVGNCSTDDGPAINSLISAVPSGSEIYFPSVASCYAIATPIAWPTTKSIYFVGNGPSEVGGSYLKAINASATSVISRGTGFIRGGGIAHMTIDGAGLSAYDLNFAEAVRMVFEDIFLLNAAAVNFTLGNGTSNTQENIVMNVRMDNSYTTTMANLPYYNFDIAGTNNNILNVKASNAKLANIFSEPTSGNNTYTSVHGYDYFSGAAQAPSYNFLIGGTGEQIMNPEGDGSATADIFIYGFSNVVTNGVFQFQGLTPYIGILLATSTSGNNIHDNVINDATTANTVVQSGTAAGNGNFANNNYNTANGVMGPHLPSGTPSTYACFTAAGILVASATAC